jgi:hypothetical protein
MRRMRDSMNLRAGNPNRISNREQGLASSHRAGQKGIQDRENRSRYRDWDADSGSTRAADNEKQLRLEHEHE